MFTRSVSPEQAPDKATYLEIDFEKGDPVALNGEKLSPATLLAQLNQVPSLGKSLKQPFGQPAVLDCISLRCAGCLPEQQRLPWGLSSKSSKCAAIHVEQPCPATLLAQLSVLANMNQSPEMC